jgi:hypothetical protein
MYNRDTFGLLGPNVGCKPRVSDRDPLLTFGGVSLIVRKIRAYIADNIFFERLE